MMCDPILSENGLSRQFHLYVERIRLFFGICACVGLMLATKGTSHLSSKPWFDFDVKWKV
jgi:hypothetical protein